MAQPELPPEGLTAVNPHPLAQSCFSAGYQISEELKQTDMKEHLGGNRDSAWNRKLQIERALPKNEP